ncbi:MAG TPA: hypothetical protein VK559_08470 [Ferruginibacter sp.]|nr:hypothetical protein [Ferruginibacter sp.]
MKIFVTIFTTAFLSSVILSSCKKEIAGTTSTIKDTVLVNDTVRINDTTPRPATIVGFYTGKIGNNTDYPSFQMAFLFRSNGTVRAFNNNITTPGYFDTSAIPPAEGVYLVSGDTVTTTCKYLYDTTNVFSTMAVIDSACTYMEGSWGSGSMNTGGGYFFVYKQF